MPACPGAGCRHSRDGRGRSGQRTFQEAHRAGGRGKSGGYRAIVAYRAPDTERILFAYAFAKNVASTLTPPGQQALSKVGEAFVSANDERVDLLLASGDVKEIECDDSRTH